MKKDDFSIPFHKLSSNSAREEELDQLCHWIDDHIEEAIGWQELMLQSGLDFQTINHLFFKHKNTTPMTWIRHRREAQRSGSQLLGSASRLAKQQSF